MAKRIFLIVLALAVLLTVSWAAPKKKLIAYHWTETIYDPINLNAVRPSALLATNRVLRSHDGVTCCGSTPTSK